MSYLSHSGANVPGSESSRERKFQGTKVPGSESSRERKFHVTFAPGSESSRERKFQRTKVPGSESTRERKFHLWYFRSWERKYVRTKVPVTFYSTFINVFKFFLERFFTSMADSTASRTADSNSDCC